MEIASHCTPGHLSEVYPAHDTSEVGLDVSPQLSSLSAANWEEKGEG